MEGVPLHTIVGASIQAGIDIVSFLFDTGIFPSKGEARKMVQGGGISINREKIIDQASLINETNLLAEKYIAVQKGKKNHYLVKLG
jgi:tyrosyl-tRNA synthetase